MVPTAYRPESTGRLVRDAQVRYHRRMELNLFLGARAERRMARITIPA